MVIVKGDTFVAVFFTHNLHYLCDEILYNGKDELLLLGNILPCCNGKELIDLMKFCIVTMDMAPCVLSLAVLMSLHPHGPQHMPQIRQGNVSVSIGNGDNQRNVKIVKNCCKKH